ncbi:MAG: hypothetical protein F7C38_00795 [Desulfurococcales archaeon]|nr:hypothetical protein [Desulfurococcales archaeon]
MVQPSHQERRLPKIKVRLTSTSTLDLTLVAWRVAERLWKKYGIEIDVEDEPYYLVDPLMGVGHSTGGMRIVVEDANGVPLAYELSLTDYDDPVEGLEHIVLGILTQGVPVIGEDSIEVLVEKDHLAGLAIA